MTIELFHTEGGSRLHIAECPHIVGKNVIRARDDVGETREVCIWSQAEIDGVGRTYHETIELALDDLNAPRSNRAELARLLREARHDTVFVPSSRSYVAVAKDGLSIAWAGKTYVQFRDGRLVELPGFTAGRGSGVARELAWGDTCPVCFTQASRNGTCACDT